MCKSIFGTSHGMVFSMFFSLSKKRQLLRSGIVLEENLLSFPSFIDQDPTPKIWACPVAPRSRGTTNVAEKTRSIRLLSVTVTSGDN